jgi:predicted amidophosphoribosyltransferase
VFGSEMRCSACGAEFAIEEVDQCPRCRAQVPSHAVRCACGCYVSGRCRRCGMQLRADDRVCPRCGRHRICH